MFDQDSTHNRQYMPISEEKARLKGCLSMMVFIAMGFALFYGIFVLIGFIRSF